MYSQDVVSQEFYCFEDSLLQQVEVTESVDSIYICNLQFCEIFMNTMRFAFQ